MTATKGEQRRVRGSRQAGCVVGGKADFTSFIAVAVKVDNREADWVLRCHTAVTQVNDLRTYGRPYPDRSIFAVTNSVSSVSIRYFETKSIQAVTVIVRTKHGDINREVV